MATSDKPKPAGAVPPDLLPIIGRSGALTDRQSEEIRAKVLSGEYPRDPIALAERLVREKILTEFQAGRFLRNKAHGLVVGRYVILDHLGEGRMGRVFKAQHRLMGRVVALKVIAPRIASRLHAVARFQREMRLVGLLDHPNVIRAFDADQVGEILYIVMEYVAGQSLDQLLRTRGPLPPVPVANYMAQAARGLAHAHGRGIVHRDVKPSNLLLTDDHRVKVLDLGLGTLVEADGQASFATAAGYTVGTVDYMSPEQASGREVDGRSDLYSLGCTMYHLLTDRLPFPGATDLERLGRRINGQPIPITEVRPDLPSRLVQVVDQLLAHQPNERFRTAAEAAEALQALTRRKIAPSSARQPSVVPGSSPAAAAPPPLSSWFRFLAFLAERSIVSVLLAFLALQLVILVVFGAGFTLGYLSAILTGSKH